MFGNRVARAISWCRTKSRFLGSGKRTSDGVKKVCGAIAKKAKLGLRGRTLLGRRSSDPKSPVKKKAGGAGRKEQEEEKKSAPPKKMTRDEVFAMYGIDTSAASSSGEPAG
eukprot:6636394-Alexandrium_andersonii.AAC.1